MADPFHHRSNFQNKRKSHKIQGKSKPSSNSKPFGRTAPNNTNHPNDRKFRHCNQFRDIGKANRKAIAKEKRKIHREKLIKNKLKYFGKIAGGTPKIIALIALSPYSNTKKIKKHLLSHCGITDYKSNEIIECQTQIGNNNKQKSNYIIYELTDRKNTFAMLDICKIADIILLICSPKPEKLSSNDNWNNSVLGLDDKSKLFCSLIKSVGGGYGTTIYGLYQAKFYKGLGNLKRNNKSQQCKLDPIIKNTFLKYLQFEFGASNNMQKNIRIFNCYDMQQLFRFMHSIKNYNDSNTTNAIKCEWKQKRPHLLVQKMYSMNSMLIVDGYLRGSIQLNVNRPIHITGYGDYLIHRVDGLIARTNTNTDKNNHQNQLENETNDDDDNIMIMNFVNDMVISNQSEDIDLEKEEKKIDNNNYNLMYNEYDSIQLVISNSERQDTLDKISNLDGLATQFDQTIITEKELKEIEQERVKMREKEKLEQKGLSDYNLAWIDNNDNNDNNDDMDMDMDMDIDVNEMNKIENDELIKQKEFEREEFEFPDEVEIDANVRAKDKFAQYRGLKQFYKTQWDKFELLPVEYSQIANIRDWQKALKITKLQNIISVQEQQQNENNENNDLIECGKKVRIYIGGITTDMYQKLLMDFNANKPLIIWNLLQHENKVSVCHYLIQKYNHYNKPIQGLKEYTFDMGFRRFKSVPIFSDNSRANKHLVKKFINDNQFVVASMYGFVTYPPIGVLMFDETNQHNDHEICCHGNLLSINAHRLLIKRKVLTGTAYRVQRRRAVIRYMFYNSDDVKYFTPVDLWTKHGLKGRIEEPIGDKGAMKCFFNGNVKQNDTICLSLYKRVFPYKDDALFNNDS